jgi:hypothetical protein
VRILYGRGTKIEEAGQGQPKHGQQEQLVVRLKVFQLQKYLTTKYHAVSGKINQTINIEPYKP